MLAGHQRRVCFYVGPHTKHVVRPRQAARGAFRPSHDRGRPCQGPEMQETGFSIWLGARCSTQAEAAELLSIDVRSVRRYMHGERQVPKPLAKLMFLTLTLLYIPQGPINPFHIATSGQIALTTLAPFWTGSRRWSGRSMRKALIPRREPISGPTVRISDNRTNGPPISDKRTVGPLKSWFLWWRPTADPTGEGRSR
jgi:hypothetical protein